MDDQRVRRYALYAAIVASGMGLLDSSATNVVLPLIQHDLHAKSTQTQWIVLGYTLFLSSLLLVAGGLGDRFGRKRMLAAGILLFALSSIACGTSPNPTILVVARSLQGVGAALMVPESLALIAAVFPVETRGAAIGTWSAAIALAAAVGPIIGGWIAQTFSWRIIFFLNVPLAALALVLLRRVAESRNPATRHLDFAGAATITLALAALTWGFDRVPQAGFDLTSILFVAVGLALGALFVLIEARSPGPMVPLRLFRSRQFSIANLYTLLLYGALGVVMFFGPFDFINVRGYAPVAVGGAMLPLVVIMTSLSRTAGAISARIGFRIPLFAGGLLTAVAFACVGLLNPSLDYWRSLFPAFVIMGIGMTTFVAPLTTAVMTSAGEQYAGAASGVNNTVSRAAGLLAIAVGSIAVAQGAVNAFGAPLPNGAALTGAFGSSAAPGTVLRLHDAYAHAFATAMVASSLAAAAGAALALFLPRAGTTSEAAAVRDSPPHAHYPGRRV